jgi:hypothetical protein
MNEYVKKLVEFVEALMEYFANNPIISKRLLYIRHYIRHQQDPESLYSNSLEFYDKYSQAILQQNSTILLAIESKFSQDINLIWESMSLETKHTTWKWITILVEILQNPVKISSSSSSSDIASPPTSSIYASSS